MDLSTLNPQQRLAVCAPEKPLLIVAGAGTGKTKTLTSRVLYLIESGVAASAICAITFTNKAAREMRDRISSQLPASFGSNPFIGTFHAFGSLILRPEAKRFGRTSSFVIFDDYDSSQIVKRVLKSLSSAGLLKPAQVISAISHWKNGQRSIPTEDEASKTERALLRCMDLYEQALREHNAFDFDDLIQKPVHLFTHHPETLSRYQHAFRHFFVDEYQDLNLVQYALLRHLAGAERRVSVVGDDQQTIYSWRGSNLSIFLNFERDWPDAQVVTLDQNYRSSASIISTSSYLIAKNTLQKPKSLWTENPAGDPVELIECADEYAQAAWIAESVIQNGAAGIAVLYRTNAQSRAIEQAFMERGVPYRIFGGVAFYERREVRDILAGVRFVANPNDTLSRERLEKNLTKRASAKFFLWAEGKESIAPADAIRGFVEAYDYLAVLERNFTNWQERGENIAELLRFAQNFPTISSFLEQASLVQSTDLPAHSSRSQSPHDVTLMTLHMAKGLEFERVYIAGCNEGLIPHNRSLYSVEELEEERRLLYVGMTRARSNLHILFHDIPSRFLSDLPQESIDFKASDGASLDLDDEERYISWD